MDTSFYLGLQNSEIDLPDFTFEKYFITGVAVFYSRKYLFTSSQTPNCAAVGCPLKYKPVALAYEC